MASIFERVRDILNKPVPGTTRKQKPSSPKAAPPASGEAKAPDLQAALHKREADLRIATARANAAKRAELARHQQELNALRREHEKELANEAQQHAAVDDTTYTIVRGDTLSGIAKRFLGNASRWPEIHKLNKDKIANANLIFPGQVIKIPPR